MLDLSTRVAAVAVSSIKVLAMSTTVPPTPVTETCIHHAIMGWRYVDKLYGLQTRMFDSTYLTFCVGVNDLMTKCISFHHRHDVPRHDGADCSSIQRNGAISREQ